MAYTPVELGLRAQDQRPYGEGAAEIAAARERSAAAQRRAPAAPRRAARAQPQDPDLTPGFMRSPPPEPEPQPEPVAEPPRDTPPSGQEMFGHPGGPTEEDIARYTRAHFPQARPPRTSAIVGRAAIDLITGATFSRALEGLRAGPVGQAARGMPVPEQPTDLLADAYYEMRHRGGPGADVERGTQRGGAQDGSDAALDRAVAGQDEHHRRAFRELASLALMGEAESPKAAMESVRRLAGIAQRLRAIGAHADAEAAMAEIRSITGEAGPKAGELATRQHLEAFEDIVGTKQASGYYVGREGESATDIFRLKGMRESVERRETELDVVPGEAPARPDRVKDEAAKRATAGTKGSIGVGGSRRLQQMDDGSFRVIDKQGKTLSEGATADEAMAGLRGETSEPPVPEGHVRLYRGESADPRAPMPKGAGSAEDARGRWFSDKREEAEFYLKDAPNARLSYVDVPRDVAEKHRVTSLGGEAAKYSRRPGEEVFLPRELADKKKPLGVGGAEPPRPPGAPPGERPPSPPAPRGAEPPAPTAGEPNLGINLDLVRSQHGAPDHLVELLRTEALAHIKDIATQRRGVQHLDVIFARARNLGIDVPALSQIRPGTAFNAEGAVALLNAIVKTAEKRLALEEQIRAAGALATPEQEARWLATVYDQNTLQRVFAGGRAELGRGMRALREVSNGANSGQIKDTFARALDAIGGRPNFDKLLQRLKDIQTNPDLSPLQREIAATKFIGNLHKPRFWDKVNELFINSILSNPLTHQANVFGQTVLHEADALSQVPAAVFDAIVSGGGRLRPRTRTMQGALVQAAAGHLAVRRAVAEGLLYMRHGVAAEDVQKFRESGVFRGGQALEDVRIRGRKVAPIGTLINLPTRALGAEDVFFNRLGYQRQLWQDAANYVARDGRDSIFGKGFWRRVADVVEHPEDFQMEGRSIAERSEEAGRRAGLRQDAGDLARLLTRVRDVEIPRTGGLAPGKFITPFVRIGFNLARVGAEYSPLGFVRVATTRGGTQADAFGRAVLGSGLWWFFWSRADAGELTGAAPSDPREKAEFYDQGKRPYAIKVGSRWVEYSRYEPVASTLKWVHGLHEAAKDVQDGVHDPRLFGSALAKATGTLARSLTDSSYLSGLQDFYSIATASDSGLDQKLERFVGNLANSVLPYSGARRFAAQEMDPVLRHPTSFVEQIEAATPGLSTGVKPYLTRYGESVGRPDRPAGIVASAEQVDPVDAELTRAHGKQKISVDGVEQDPARIFASLPQQDIAGFKLNKDEGFMLQQVAGRATHKELADLFADQRQGKGEDGRPKFYSAMTDREKSAAISAAISDARRTARATVADAILDSATSDGQVERGAVMRLATLSKVSDRAAFLTGLRARGLLTQPVRDFLDRNRRLGERTVEQYLRTGGGGQLPVVVP